MMRSELRATVSSGLTRPPTSTGIFPNFARSTFSLVFFGGRKLAAIQSKAKPKTIAGMKRFMRAQFFSAVKNQRDDSRTERAIRRRQSRTLHKARRSSDCALLAESTLSRPAEIQPDKMSRPGNAAD